MSEPVTMSFALPTGNDPEFNALGICVQVLTSRAASLEVTAAERARIARYLSERFGDSPSLNGRGGA